MSDLERQVRDYAVFLDSTLPTIKADDVVTERIGTGPVRSLRPREPRHRWP